jgi:hypothetical protein
MNGRAMTRSIFSGSNLEMLYSSHPNPSTNVSVLPNPLIKPLHRGAEKGEQRPATKTGSKEAAKMGMSRPAPKKGPKKPFTGFFYMPGPERGQHGASIAPTDGLWE